MIDVVKEDLQRRFAEISEMGIIRPPLQLALELTYNQYDHFTNGKPDGTVAGGIAKTVAAALVERMTPVEARTGTIQESPCCHTVLSGYPEDHFRRALPKFCPNCGKPLVWK